MFRLPEIASLLGIVVDPQVPIGTKNLTSTYRGKLTEILSDNLEASMDFSKLADKIAGKTTVAKQLDLIANQVFLCRANKPAQAQARHLLEKFCQDGDPAAYEAVDWQFRDDPKYRNSKSHGVRGVLIARRSVTRTTPRERAVRDTTALFASLVPTGSGYEDTLEQYTESQGQAVASDNAAAKRVADLLRSLASGEVPSSISDAQVHAALLAVTQSTKLDPGILDAEASRWDKLAGDQEDAVVYSPNLILGIAQLSAYRLKGADSGEVLYPDIRPEAGDKIVLKVSGVVDTRVSPLDFPVGKWDEETLEQIRVWLRDKAVPSLQDEDVDEDTEESDVIDTRDLCVEISRGPSPEKSVPLGQVVLTWSPQWAELVESTGQSLSAWSLKPDGVARSDSAHSRRLFSKNNIPVGVNCAEPVSSAWHVYRKSLGTTDNWALTALVGPTPKEAKSWVKSWAEAIDVGVSSEKNAQQIMAEMQKANQEGKADQVAILLAQLQAVSGGVRQTAPIYRHNPQSTQGRHWSPYRL